jgi:hypothetical protein
MEIPISEGFRRYGICSELADTLAQWIISGLRVGVSSRALGSVQQIGGSLMVGDDLEIICWDAVGQNSTPGAVIDMDEKNLQPFIESVDYNVSDKKIIKEDKFSKFDAWLND